MKTAALIAFVGVAAAIQVVTADAHTKSSLRLTASGSLAHEKPEDPTPISGQPLLGPDLEKKPKKTTPEGGRRPVIPHHIGEWKESQVPILLQYLLATAWILMLAAIPFITPVIDKQAVTRTQMVVGGMMLVVLFGGLYLFTHIILFQSAHFKEVRPLTIVECIYFMAQVITTVGYGDVTPAKIRGQVFVGLYVLGALFIISMLISDITNHMINMAKEYREKLAAKQAAERTPRTPKMVTIGDLFMIEKPSAKGLINAFAIFAVIDVIWVAFFSLHPDEGKTLFQAFYMSVITLSTVGFGYFTPVTESGMIFGAFFMLFGSAALVNVITNFTQLMVKLNEWERFNLNGKESVNESLHKLEELTNGSEMVTEAQFMEFSLMQMKLVSKSELECIHQAFDHLQPDRGQVRKVSMRAIEQTLASGTK